MVASQSFRLRQQVIVVHLTRMFLLRPYTLRFCGVVLTVREQQRIRLLLFGGGCGERNYAIGWGPGVCILALQTLASERCLQASAGNRLGFRRHNCYSM